MKYWIISVIVMLAILGALHYVFDDGGSGQPGQYSSSSSGGSDDQYKNFHIP